MAQDGKIIELKHKRPQRKPNIVADNGGADIRFLENFAPATADILPGDFPSGRWPHWATALLQSFTAAGAFLHIYPGFLEADGHPKPDEAQRDEVLFPSSPGGSSRTQRQRGGMEG
jgi:hypothetical protein